MIGEIRLAFARWLCPAKYRIVPRDPSPKMLNAACKAMTKENRPTRKWVGDYAKHRIRYNAMIRVYEQERQKAPKWW